MMSFIFTYQNNTIEVLLTDTNFLYTVKKLGDEVMSLPKVNPTKNN